MYGGLAAALPLLAAVRSAREAGPGGDASLPRPVTPAQFSLAADEEGYVRGARRRTRHGRCQLQFPSIRDRAGTIASEGGHGL
jgi:hypothetical protein